MSSPVDVDESLEISIFNMIDFPLHRLLTEEVSYGHQPPELEEEVCKIVGIKSHAWFRGYGLPLPLFFGLGELYGTSLHVAAKRGRVGVMKEILDASPEEMELVNQRGENCLHIAVLYNQERSVRFLVDWLAKNRDYAHLIDGKDSDGKTPLHLAVSRKQIKILEVLLSCNVVDVNAMSSGGFTALDILDVLPYDRMIDVEIGRILGQAGALRARGLAKRDTYQYSAHDDKIKWFKRKWLKKKWFKKTDVNTIIPLMASHVVVVLMATLVAIVTYQAAYHTLNGILNGGYFHSAILDGTLQLKKQELVITRSFILLNSIGFVGSLAVVMSLLREFPFKPWSQISVSMLFGSYMSCIISMSPSEAWILLFLAIPLLLLAAAGKLFGIG